MRAGERGQRQQAEPVPGHVDVRHDNDRRAQRCARRHADQVGISQRVAEDALVRGPAHRQRRADETGQQHARQAHVPDDRPRGGGDVVRAADAEMREQDADGVVERDRRRAECQAEERRCEQQRAPQRQPWPEGPADSVQQLVRRYLPPRRRLDASAGVCSSSLRYRCCFERSQSIDDARARAADDVGIDAVDAAVLARR